MTDSTLLNDDQLVPELKAWNGGKGIGLEDWITCIGNFEHALGYAALLWPRFLEHDGCVFYAAGFTVENYENWRNGGRGDRKFVQATMNHRHVADLFPNVHPEPTRAQVVRFGRFLQEILSAKLARDFPGKKIEVDFDDDDSDDLLDYVVTFFAVDAV